jgi:hypothetical protein
VGTGAGADVGEAWNRADCPVGGNVTMVDSILFVPQLVFVSRGVCVALGGGQWRDRFDR